MTRIEELQNKMRTGAATPADIAELKSLLASPQKLTDAKPLPPIADIKAGMSSDAQKALNLSAMAEKPTEAQLTGRAPFTDKSYKLDDKTKATATKLASGDFSPITDPEKVAKYQKDIEEARLPKPQEPQIELAKPDIVKPVVKVAPKAVEEPKVEVKPEETKGEAKGEKKLSFGDKLKKLGTTYGVPLLDILQAVGYQRGGISKATNADMKYQSKLDKEERDYIAMLDQQKAAAAAKAQEDLLYKQQEFDATQAALDRLALKESTGAKLSADERLLRLQLAVGGKSGGAKKSLIPE